TNAGNPGRWDIRGAVGNTNVILTTSNQPFSITKVGSNQISLVNVNVDPALAHINIQQGIMGFEGNTTLGNPLSNLTVSAGATLNFFQPAGVSNDFTKVFVLNGDGVNPTLRNQSGNSTLHGAMSLSGA